MDAVPHGPGRPLTPAVRYKMETFFGADFSDVRIHTGPQASALGARAFTLGTDIFFAPGQYDPDSVHGQRLLGHELTHVVQQRAGRVRNPYGNRLAVVQDPRLEAEAERLGALAATPGLPAQAPAQALFGAAAPATVIQMLSAKVTVVGGVVGAASVGGSAPATNLRGARGDHTTPYSSFEAMARNNVIGNSLATAVGNLVVTLKRIKNLPGYLSASSVYRKALDKYGDPWIEYGEGLTAPTKTDVESLMQAVVTLRNAVPYTAFKNRTSTGGHGEASSVGGLDWAEFKVRSGAWTAKTDFTGNPMKNVWDTFDWLAAPGMDAGTWAEVLNQHMLSIKESFPHIFEIRGIYSIKDMRDYLVNHLLTSKFGGTFAGQVAGSLIT